MFSRMTLKSQLLGAFGAVLVAMVALTAYQISTANSTEASLDSLFFESFEPSVTAGEIRVDLARSDILTHRLAEADLEEGLRAEATAGLLDNLTDIDEELAFLIEHATPEELVHLQQLQAHYDVLRPIWAGVAAASGEDQIVAAEAVVADHDYRDEYEAADHAIDEELVVKGENAHEFYEEAHQAAETAHTVSIVTSVIVVLGALALAFFVARRVSAQVAGSANSVSTRAAGLTEISAELSASAGRTAEQANTAAAASEQVSASVQTVAAAVEEMGAAVNEIAQNTSRASEIAGRAVDVAERTSGTVTKLSASSNEISAVIDVITSIAEQTNLLALNATIEAARAGEAGKGFAVVASEVQDLARETAKATEEIAASVAGIQTDSGDAISAIGEISEIIAQINDIQTTIATAVEEQAASNNEISRSVAEAAEGTRAIAENIALVASAADSTTESAATTSATAGELTGVAGQLQAIVERSAAQPGGYADAGGHAHHTTRIDRAPVVPQSADQLSRQSRAELARTLAAYEPDSYETSTR